MATRYFTPKTFRFLQDLEKNNNRPWFTENKGRYEKELKEPALRFIEDFESRLMKISPHFHAGRRSFFRIHRDTRFSKDKSPYKTYAGIQFRHEARGSDVHAPGFYLHIQPGHSGVGCGMWHPDSKSLSKIREAIVEEPAKWKRARVDRGFPEDGAAWVRYGASADRGPAPQGLHRLDEPEPKGNHGPGVPG
jgi:uncharacterized protein (TIGR02453 family)